MDSISIGQAGRRQDTCRDRHHLRAGLHLEAKRLGGLVRVQLGPAERQEEKIQEHLRVLGRRTIRSDAHRVLYAVHFLVSNL
jgi:hypothetical protein